MPVKKVLGNKPSYSTMSLDIFQYVNHNIDIGLQLMDTDGWHQKTVACQIVYFILMDSFGGMMVCT